MPSTTDIFSLAQQRQQAQALPYAGAGTAASSSALPVALTAVERRDVPEDFLSQLTACAARDEILLFLCRSGVRSRHAALAATENGYTQCFDILEGFEGDRDTAGHRKSIGGWCHAGLPWIGA